MKNKIPFEQNRVVIGERGGGDRTLGVCGPGLVPPPADDRGGALAEISLPPIKPWIPHKDTDRGRLMGDLVE